MKYALFIYFYNHILVLIICVNNSLGASTLSYGMSFLKKLCFSNQSPCCRGSGVQSFVRRWVSPSFLSGAPCFRDNP